MTSLLKFVVGRDPVARAGRIQLAALLSLAAMTGGPARAIAQTIPGDDTTAVDTTLVQPDTVPAFPLPALRWVGIRRDVPTVGLWFEFYPDTMLMVNDVRLRHYASSYRITEDSIIATGDTVFRVKYELVLDRMLIYTAEGETITMSRQSTLARPFFGDWLGVLSTPDSAQSVLLRVARDGSASWRPTTGGEAHEGEWDRAARRFTFNWEADSTTWVGYHDPEGNALQFFQTIEGSGISVFRKSYR